jgi:NAD(P)-dependent dehydrogenase (short-subunit alcohol dehydrogenase family)
VTAMLESIGLEGSVIVVTGASSGIGRSLVTYLSNAGARLVCCARREDRLDEIRSAHPGVVTIRADVTDESDVRAVAAAALATFGRIDGLVNNAGVSKAGPALQESLDDFRWTLEANLVAPFSMAKHIVPEMRRTGGGSIVNISSVMAIRSIDQLPEAGYVASKAGLIALTRELASQWGRHGVRVNAVAPGFFQTEMTDGLINDDGVAPVWLTREVPLGRVGDLQHLHPAIAHLLGPGSAYTTGHTLVVDGGITTR